MSRSFMAAFSAFAIRCAGYKKKVADPIRREKYIEKLRKNNESLSKLRRIFTNPSPKSILKEALNCFISTRARKERLFTFTAAHTVNSRCCRIFHFATQFHIRPTAK